MDPWLRPLQPKGGKAAQPENFTPFNAPGEEGQGDVLPLFPGHGENGRRSLSWIPRESVPSRGAVAGSAFPAAPPPLEADVLRCSLPAKR